MNWLIKTNILTSKVLAEGLKKIVKLEGVDEKKEPYEKTKKITKGVVVALSSEAKQKVIIKSLSIFISAHIIEISQQIHGR